MASQQFIRFVITGGIAACVNIGVRIPLGFVMPYSASIVLAYLIGMTTAFMLARLFVFDDARGQSATAQYARFALVNGVALLQVWLVSILLEAVLFPRWGFAWHPQTVAHAIGVMSPVITSYYGHKFFSFRGSARQPSA
jgi:putative flippase GtrA